MLRLGLISDTHGLLRPEALAALRGCDRIVHAGDIGDPGILAKLGELAPVTAVRGNNDKGEWAEGLRELETLELDEIRLVLVHDLAQHAGDPAVGGARVVVHGHSHKPSVQERGEVLFVNPGSAGPRRFKLPVSLGELTVVGSSVTARLFELAVTSAGRGTR